MSDRDQVAPGNVGTQATILVRANSEDAGQLGVGKEQQETCSKEEVRSKKSDCKIRLDKSGYGSGSLGLWVWIWV